MKNLFLKYQKLLFVSLVLVCILLFGILSYRASFAFVDNADSHWIGVLTHFAESNDTYSIPSHTSAIKIPIVYIFNKILGFNLLSYSIINLTIMFGMIIPSLLIIFKFSKSDEIKVKISKFIIFSLIITGSTYFFMNSAMTSLRNIEMGIVVLIYYLEISLLTSSISKNKFWWTLSIIFILAFIITITDELNLILLLSPLLVLIGYFKIYKFNFDVLFKVFFANLIPSGIAFVLLSGLLNKFKFPIHINQNSPLIFNNFENIGKILQNTFSSIVDMFGSRDFANQHISIASLTNIAVFIISIYFFLILLNYTKVFIKSKTIILDNSNLLLFFLSISVIFNIIAYLVFDFSANEGTGRYLIWIVVATATFAGIKNVLNFDRLKNIEFGLILVLLLGLFFLNSYFDSKYLKSVYPDLNYYKKLDEIISENHSKFAIGGYWQSFNTTFNTSSHIEIAPYTQCQPYTYTSLKSMYETKPDLLIINHVRDTSWDNCSNEDIVKLFGIPIKKYQVGDDDIWILKI